MSKRPRLLPKPTTRKSWPMTDAERTAFNGFATIRNALNVAESALAQTFATRNSLENPSLRADAASGVWTLIEAAPPTAAQPEPPPTTPPAAVPAPAAAPEPAAAATVAPPAAP